VERAQSQAILEVVLRLLKNEDGFTVTEVGVMAALTVIAIERVLLKF
jgi:Flp pilus assembly pilin Flp